MKTSDALNEMAPSLIAAMGKFKNPKPDSKATVQTRAGGTYSYDYLSLPALLDAVRRVFAEHGLAVLQELISADEPGRIGVVTRIVHSLSGQYIECGPVFMPSGGTPQEHGSAATYLRRYALAAAVGLAADEDDDGAKVQHRQAASERPSASSDPTSEGGGTQSLTGKGAEGSAASGSIVPHAFKGDSDGPCEMCGWAAEHPVHRGQGALA